MPRRNRPNSAKPRRGRGDAGKPASDIASSVSPAGLGQRRESYHGVDYLVRALAGSGTSGPYRCPGCDQLLPGTTAHVVVWPEHDGDASDRRHWHTSCWSARGRRTPVIERSRNAPRYS